MFFLSLQRCMYLFFIHKKLKYNFPFSTKSMLSVIHITPSMVSATISKLHVHKSCEPDVIVIKKCACALAPVRSKLNKKIPHVFMSAGIQLLLFRFLITLVNRPNHTTNGLFSLYHPAQISLSLKPVLCSFAY